MLLQTQAAFAQVLLGSFGGGFFYEALNWLGHGFGAATLALDIAVAGFGVGGRYTKDDDGAGDGFLHSTLHGCGEGSRVGQGLVGRGNDQHGVGAAFHCRKRCKRESWCGITACRLQQSTAQFNACFTQLFRCQKAMILTGNDDGIRHLNIDIT